MSRSAISIPASARAVLGASRVSDVMASPRANKRWRPGLPGAEHHPCHNEIFASSADGAGAALALALARDALQSEQQGPLVQTDDQRPMLWVQTRDAIKRSGRPYVHGLPEQWRRRVIHVETQSAADALFALEEGLRCCDLAFVLGEISGNPRALDFTASRRLTLTAQNHGVRLYLVRLDAKPDLSSARMRWNVRSAPSPRPRWNGEAPGLPTWQAELFRARAHPIGEWSLHDDAGTLAISQPSVIRQPIAIPKPANSETGAADYGDLARPTVGRSLAAL